MNEAQDIADRYVAVWTETDPAAAPRNGGRHEFVRTPDGRTRLAVRDWGDGHPVLFLSSWGLCSDAWNYQMAPLAEAGLRCIAYDRRGHGRSGDPGGGYDYDTLADDLAAVIETLDLSRVTLVGHSMAGGEIVRYLSRYADRGRVARIALVGATTPFMLKTPDNPDGIDGAVFEQFRQESLLRDLPKWLEENVRPFVMPDTSVAMMEWIKTLLFQCSMQAALQCNRAVTSTDFRPELSSIKVPALVVHGDKDVSALLELTGRRTARLIPGAELRVYEGAPHGLFLTHQRQLNDDLLAFVNA